MKCRVHRICEVVTAGQPGKVVVEYNRFVVRKTDVTNFSVQGRKAMTEIQIQSMSLDMYGTLQLQRKIKCQ